jgi:uncharacterized membrane protein
MMKKALLAAIVFIIILIFIKRIVSKVRRRIEDNDIQTNSKYSKRLS